MAHNVPMQGGGFYSANSGLQYEAMKKALPLIKRAIIQTSAKNLSLISDGFTIVEYGCSDGNNSLEPFVAIMESLESHAYANLIFNDRPENDFSVVAGHITKLQQLLMSKSGADVFLSMVPASFYSSVVKPSSAHFGFSLYCLQHLDRAAAPPQQSHGEFLSDALKQIPFKEQADIDLRNFLTLRATEILPGGSLVLTFTGQAQSGEPNVVGIVSSLRDATAEMVQEGKVSRDAASSFHIPVYSRTAEATKSVLADMGSSWIVREHFDEWVTHPATEEMALRRSRRSLKEEDYVWYAGVAVDWGMAISAGHFQKALQGDGLDQNKVNTIMAEWEEKTKVCFLKSFKEQALRCTTTYLRLERVQL
ncbi:S-adenosyl-L-methionine-dependent methyltransferase [Cucurbitaria berberidis CBS 394.84]|uniref:S-adenosyl-L-methionine-dependent methyltransferase n=1 Tax=Cucurbitaria berberidis CBS 394.84 TaxID=1168544 RepID=A0A9P4LBE5_9PLEO|nr:S-adenosyl-L-methionine-dependent methyltransferase [Cucurbitaria berberidis CBS 394.84]KAF1848287.1 S-adenosyl-L-methionine-dependent methyltransferase [Cucurbitaria berberidis CBS 394.84]